jgi:hypothetical protein
MRGEGDERQNGDDDRVADLSPARGLIVSMIPDR